MLREAHAMRQRPRTDRAGGGRGRKEGESGRCVLSDDDGSARVELDLLRASDDVAELEAVILSRVEHDQRLRRQD
eukprot:2125324-Rhodomonas_salina.1